MAEVKIITEEKEEKKEPDQSDISETLAKADEYQKLKDRNDKLEAEYLRQQELKAKIAMGGMGLAGTERREKTEEEKAKEEAQKIIDLFNPDAK